MKNALLFVLSVIALCAACSSIPLSSKAQAEIATHGAVLAQCQAVGRDAGTVAAYNACKADAGIQ